MFTIANDCESVERAEVDGVNDILGFFGVIVVER